MKGYTKAGKGKGTIDTSEALAQMLERLDIIRGIIRF